jgi:hypothetical protein
MSLISNTQKLMSNSTDARVPIEFHFLTHRELYDSSIFSADRRHSDAGRWVLQGDGHWYTINIVTHPVDALPQELCLSFDCFRTIESVSIKLATFTNNNVPAETVANELGCLISLLVREPLLALGVRRMDGRPVKWDSGYAASWRPPPTNRIPDKGINSVEFSQILHVDFILQRFCFRIATYRQLISLWYQRSSALLAIISERRNSNLMIRKDSRRLVPRFRKLLQQLIDTCWTD